MIILMATVGGNMPPQKSREEFASFWDGTSWRDEYYERLTKTSPAELTRAQLAEREYCLIEARAVEGMIARAHRIADLGCGTGRVTVGAIERYPEKRFVGVDLSDGQLAVFRARLSSSASQRVTLINSSIADLSLPDGSIDLVLLCNHTFGAILSEERKRSLSIIARLLAEGGKLLIVGFSNLSLARECYKNWQMTLISIDERTGLIDLESHRSLWEPDSALLPQLERFGFSVSEHRRFTLGYLMSLGATASPEHG